MAVTKAAQRRFDIAGLEKEIKQLKAEIIEGEFAERLNNADWASLCKFYRAAVADRLAPLEDMKKLLVSTAMTPADSTKLREQVMLLERDAHNTEDFLGFPTRMAEILKPMRERLEAAEKQLKSLKGE